MKKTVLTILALCFYTIIATAQEQQQALNSFKITINTIDIGIQFYNSKTVRILKSPTTIPFNKESLSVIGKAENLPIDVTKKDDITILTSSALQVTINTISGKISFQKLNGTPLFAEKHYGVSFYQTKDIDKSMYSVRQEFALEPKEAIYGLGQFQHGKMVQRDQKLLLRQDNQETVIPFFQSIKGYGIFWDNYSPTIFEDTPKATSFDSEVGNCVDYYFMYGKNADGVIAEMRNLTGQAPLFPYWTFGYWQSRERYKSQEETIGVVKKYRELGVPLDGIIQDWQYWGDNYHWNAMEFGNPNFPNPKAMVDAVHNLNAHIIISVWASFGPQTKQFPELEEKGMLLDFTTWPTRLENTWPPKPTDHPSGVKVYDAYNPEARDIYWKYLNKGVFSKGIDGWWLDSTEPDHLEIKDSDFDNNTYLGSFRKVRNAFPLMTVGGVYDHQRQNTNDKRVFILTRSAFAGQQRYGANSWSGDISSTWEVLHNQISAGLNFSLCGIPYWNTDIGGFFSNRGGYHKGVNDVAYRELYVRWIQFGAFSTMMRSHGTETPREIYQFGEKGDWEFDAIEKFINLRYRLLPYIYSTSWDVTANSSSMIRALMMDFADDEKALDINDQYLFGKSILVSPVTEAQYTTKHPEQSTEDFSTIKTSTTYLPKGTDWYDFWNGEKLKGGQTVPRETPVDIMPLYIKAGTILPLGPKVQYANEKIDPTEIRIYTGADGKFTLYDDEKDNYNYEKGYYATVEFSWNDKDEKLTIGKRKGTFEGMLKKRVFNIVLVDKNNGIGEEPSEHITETINYRGKKKSVNFNL